MTKLFLGPYLPITTLVLLLTVVIGLAIYFRLKKAVTNTKELGLFSQSLSWIAFFIMYAPFCFMAGHVAASAEESNMWTSYVLPLALYLVPLPYFYLSTYKFTINDTGFPLIFGIDYDEFKKGLWFLPKGIAQVFRLTKSLYEYEFPADEEGAAPIEILTGSKMIVELNEKKGTVKSRFVNTADEDQQSQTSGVFNFLVYMRTTIFMTFRVENSKEIYQNYAPHWKEGNEAAVIKEIARQVRDYAVAELAIVFSKKSAEEIQRDLADINKDLRRKMAQITKKWGIELTRISITVEYQESIEQIFADIAKKNLDVIVEFQKQVRDVRAFELTSKAIEERGKKLGFKESGELQEFARLWTAIEVAKGSTNYNIGHLADLIPQGLLAKLTGGK